jgi:hypothetical protein
VVLTSDIIELARKYGRYEYRRITALLRLGTAAMCTIPAVPGDGRDRQVLAINGH